MTTPDIDFIANLTPYDLAAIAECGVPDSPTSMGSHFLNAVRNDVIDLLRDDEIDNEVEEYITEVADNAPGMYNRVCWMEFTDLEAWNENTQDFDGTTTMTDAAGKCLYAIARRLATRLLERAGVPAVA